MTEKCDRCRCKLPSGQAHQVVHDNGEFERLCWPCTERWWHEYKLLSPLFRKGGAGASSPVPPPL